MRTLLVLATQDASCGIDQHKGQNLSRQHAKVQERNGLLALPCKLQPNIRTVQSKLHPQSEDICVHAPTTEPTHVPRKPACTKACKQQGRTQRHAQDKDKLSEASTHLRMSLVNFDELVEVASCAYQVYASNRLCPSKEALIGLL